MTVSQPTATKPNPETHEPNPFATPAESDSPRGLTEPARVPKSSADSPLSKPGGGLGTTIVWTVVAIVVAGLAYKHESWLPQTVKVLGMEQKAPPKPPARVIPVVTAPVVQKDMEVYINGLGTVTAFKTVTIRSRVEGELVKVAFTEGQMVKEGDLLAEIDRRQYDVQHQQALGQLERDEATLKSAEFTLKRYTELIGSKSITPQQMDEQRALVQQTAGAIQSDQANIANAKLQLDFCHIIAPISGRIGLRLVDQGNIIRANDPTGMAVITQLQPISLVFTIPQDDISRVQKAFSDNPDLVVSAWDRDFKTRLAVGKLLAIDNQVDATTGTVRLKAIFDNEDNLLFPNQFVNVRLLVDVKKDQIVVPNASVQRGPTSVFVYVVETKPPKEGSDEKIEEADLRVVTVGMIEGAETAILSGLAPGEVVATEGLDKLQKGTTVTTAAAKEKKDKEKGEKGKEKESDKKSGGPEKGSHSEKKSGEKKALDKKTSQ